MILKKNNGLEQRFDESKILNTIALRSEGLVIDPIALFEAFKANIVSGISTRDLEKVLIMSAAALAETNLDYDKLATRLFLQRIYKEVLGKTRSDVERLDSQRMHFTTLFAEDMYDPRMASYDLDELADSLDLVSDERFTFIGITALYEKLLARKDGRVVETPQIFFLRVAMGLHLNEKSPELRVIDLYHLYAQHLVISSTPTLYYSGMRNAQLSSCGGGVIADTSESIFTGVQDSFQLGKWSYGIGTSVSKLRSIGSPVKSTGITSSGIIPFLKIYDSVCNSVNRGGRKRGAMQFTLENWHYETEDFIKLRRNSGDENMRTHNLNTVLFISDEFMRRVEANERWMLVDPREAVTHGYDLTELFGKEFVHAYTALEALADEGKLHLFKFVSAKSLWKSHLLSLFETGHPWVSFKDTMNIRNPNRHAGRIYSTNLCCIAGDQRVPTEKGLLTVKELFDLGTRNSVVGREKIETASEMLLPRPNAPIVRIHTLEGYTHKVTPDHKVWVKDLGWVEAQNLREDDLLLIQQIEGLFGPNHNPEVAFLVGLIAGDGTFSRESVCIDLWEGKTSQFIPRVMQYVADLLFKYKEDFSEKSLTKGAFIAPGFRKLTNPGVFRLSSALLYQVLKNRFGYDRNNKTRVPDFIWKSDRETVSAYLKGLFLCDGTCFVSKSSGGVQFSSINGEFTRELQILLANFAIKSSINFQDRETSLLPDSNRVYKEYKVQPLYRLCISGMKTLRKLEAITSLGYHRENAMFLDYIESEGYAERNWVHFSHLEELANEDAYCLAVDSEEHSWIANGLVTKNTEIAQNSKPSLTDEGHEYFNCFLGSVNLSEIYDSRADILDYAKLHRAVRVLIRSMDNANDLNFYPTEAVADGAMRYRSVGVGLMGFQDLLFKLRIPFDSDAARDLLDEITAHYSYAAIESSAELAEERGSYSAFEGSLWSQGVLPMDTLDLLASNRGAEVAVNRDTYGLPWDTLRNRVKRGMRNGYVMSPAPNASTAIYLGVYPCIEPQYASLYAKENMLGKFPVFNKYLIADLQDRDIPVSDVLGLLKANGGNIRKAGLPRDLEALYKGAFDIEPGVQVEHAKVMAKWIDQSHSRNLFIDTTSGKVLSDAYLEGWRGGVKTFYYLRSRAATDIEKSTV